MALIVHQLRGRHGVSADGRVAGVRLLRPRRAACVFRVSHQLPGRDRFEQVSVTPSELEVRKVRHRGQVGEWTLNPLWVQLDREVHEEFGIQRCSWCRVDAGYRSRLPRPRRKGELRKALAAAIGAAKRGANLTGDRTFGNRVEPARPATYIRTKMMTLAIHRPAICAKPGTRCAAPPTTMPCAAPSPYPRQLARPAVNRRDRRSRRRRPGRTASLFRRWAGLTPKAFLQALTLDRARGLLRESASVLDAAYEVRAVRPRPAARSLHHARGHVAGRMEDRGRRLDACITAFIPRRSEPRS